MPFPFPSFRRCRALGCAERVERPAAFCDRHWAMLTRAEAWAVLEAHGTEGWREAVARAQVAIAKLDHVGAEILRTERARRAETE